MIGMILALNQFQSGPLELFLGAIQGRFHVQNSHIAWVPRVLLCTGDELVNFVLSKSCRLL